MGNINIYACCFDSGFNNTRGCCNISAGLYNMNKQQYNHYMLSIVSRMDSHRMSNTLHLFYRFWHQGAMHIALHNFMGLLYQNQIRTSHWKNECKTARSNFSCFGLIRAEIVVFAFVVAHVDRQTDHFVNSVLYRVQVWSSILWSCWWWMLVINLGPKLNESFVSNFPFGLC